MVAKPAVTAAEPVFIRPRLILGAAVFLQLTAGIVLIQAGSVGGGLNPSDYMALALCALTFGVWMLASWRHRAAVRWAQRPSVRLRALLIGAAVATSAGVWLLSVNPGVKQFVGLNALLVALVLIVTLPDDQVKLRMPNTLVVGLTCLLLLPLLITVLSRMPFSPDEAHWADYASSAFAATDPGVYARTWLMEPTPITPGAGWSVAAYGWTLKHLAFDIRIGRLWNFAANLIAIGAIGLLAYRLYGRRAALGAMVFAALSMAFIQVFDYRPDHQIPAAVAVVFTSMVIARQTRRRWRAIVLDGLAGILATTALQLHAVAIALVAGAGLFYLLLTVYRLRHMRPQWQALMPLLAFIIGAAAGSVLYYALNIAPVGGFAAYWASIGGRAGRLYLIHPLFSWPSLLEFALILLGFALLMLRRSREDRLFLVMVGCLIAALLILDTQGYRSAVSAVYAIPVGAFLAAGLGLPGRRRANWALLAVTALLGAQSLGFLDRQGISDWLRTGQLTDYVYREISSPVQARLRGDDVVVSTHLLIWAMGDRPGFYSTAGELTGAVRWGVEPEAVWERIQPTVIVEIPGQMAINPGLQTYMEQEGFTQCDSLEARNLRLNFYRTDCSLTPPG